MQANTSEPNFVQEHEQVQEQGQEREQGLEQELQPFDAKAFLKTVPGLPGCYRMYNQANEVIYVGKAKDLKKRLSSYFVKEQNAKTSALVSHIARIEFTITFSETEALILENELIKKYQPHYNILLRDDKSYPYLLLTSEHEHPGIYFHRGAKRKKGDYFGPFPDSSAVKDSLRLMQKLFPIRQCEDTVYAHRSRPCLMAQIGKCLAPCVPMSKEQEQQYHEQVDLIRLFLQGRNQELLSAIVQKMEEHASKMEFEQAAALRDQLTTLRRVQESNSIISGIEYPVDIIGFAMREGMACIHVLFIRHGRIFGSRSFFPKLRDYEQSSEDILLSFLCQFYLNDEHPNLIPDEVVIDLTSKNQAPIEQLEPIEQQQLELPTTSQSQETQEPEQASGHEYEHEHKHDHAHDQEPAQVGHQEDFSDEFLDDLEEIDFADLDGEPQVSKAHKSSDNPHNSGKPELKVKQEHWAERRNYRKQAYQESLSLAAQESSSNKDDFSEAKAFIGQIKSKQQAAKLLEQEQEQERALATAVATAVAKAVPGTGTDAETKAQREAGESAAAASAAAAAALATESVSVAGAVVAAVSDGAGDNTQESKESSKGQGLGELEVLKTAIKERFDKKIRFVKGARGAKKKYLLLAMANAQVALDAKLGSQSTAEQRINDLESLLGISGIKRMECYDISHTMGELTVGSCVVFNREGPDSSRYRRYNIEGITPGDDFAAMHQVLQRRFKDPDGSECPQLIFIDGGPGQLKQAEEVITQQFEHCTTPMPNIVAVAKGEGRKEGLETLIKAFSHERIKLGLNSPALQLVIHIRDESHRFAITGHRNRRSKERRTSKLESISGIGPKRRQALLKHLGGMQEVLKASVSELQKVPGISPKLAQHIYDQLHA